MGKKTGLEVGIWHSSYEATWEAQAAVPGAKHQLSANIPWMEGSGASSNTVVPATHEGDLN